ncbi:unnamed protein product [Moneuplotes crassus]|uniref:Peptidase C19 ubiquitin carboxyl-terminal hydrolase domain-containing protein n=1 Tax=Euplotes crassus TaxID=5936 RepID=A0AAD1U0A2_EUPCR|nr:unnamed protein product [Moneuplotes crassus]
MTPEYIEDSIDEPRTSEFLFLHILLVIPEFVQYYTQRHPEWDADEEKFKFSRSIRQVIYQYFDEDIEKINISEFWDLLKSEVEELQKNNLLALFMTLLERLEEEKRLGMSLTFNKRFNNPYAPTLAHTTFDPSIMKQDRELFIGTYEAKYQCKTCWNSNIEYEKFMNIPINFYKNDSYKGFQEFLEMHKIRTSGKMHCKHCSRNQMLLNQSSSHELQDCFVQKRIVEYPLCLIVVISKRNNFKQFMNFELDFSHGFPSPVHYTNIGIILHTGSTRCGYKYCTKVKVNGERKLIIPSGRPHPPSIAKFGFHDHILVYSLQSKD